MKKLLAILTVGCAIAVSGQAVSDYSYIFVPRKFKDFKENQYRLNEMLVADLKAHNYKVLTQDAEFWPPEISQNPCQVLRAELVDASSMLRNKVTVEFKDCNDKLVGTLSGKSSLKEFEPGFRDALLMATNTLAASAPSADHPVYKETAQTVAVPVKQTFQVVEKPVSNKPVAAGTTVAKNTGTAAKAHVYSNGLADFNTIYLSESQFILVKTGESIPYATFRTTSKKDVYKVLMANGEATVGYSEDGRLVIETTAADGTSATEVFTKKN